jgi:hypothetical protein
LRDRAVRLPVKAREFARRMQRRRSHSAWPAADEPRPAITMARSPNRVVEFVQIPAVLRKRMQIAKERPTAEVRHATKQTIKTALPLPARAKELRHRRLRLPISISGFPPPQHDEVNKNVQRCTCGRSERNKHGHLPA